MKENTTLNFIVLFFTIEKIVFSKKFIDSWIKTKYCKEMYSNYFSWNGFLPTLWWKSHSEIYLFMVNCKTLYTHRPTLHLVHWNFIDVPLILAAHTHAHSTTNMILWLADSQCVRLQGRSLKMRFPCTHFQQILKQDQTEFSVVCLLVHADRMM